MRLVPVFQEDWLYKIEIWRLYAGWERPLNYR